MPEVSAEVIGKLFGISPSMITRLSSQGVITPSSKNKYELGVTVQSYINHLKRNRNEPEQGTTKATLEHEKLMLAQIEREKAEINLELFKGNLHKDEHVTLLVGQMIAAAKTKLSAMPSKLAPKLVSLDNKSDIRAIIETEIDEALIELSEFNPETYLDNLIEYEDIADDEEG